MILFIKVRSGGIKIGIKAIWTGIKFCEKQAIVAIVRAKMVRFLLITLLIAFIKIAVKFVFAIAAASAPSKI